MTEKTPITLDCLESQLNKLKKDDLTKKINIAANILRRCEMHVNIGNTTKSKSVLEKTYLYTGVHKGTLKIIAKMVQKRKTFTEFIFDERLKLLGHSFAYLNIRKHLVESYTKQYQIPVNIKYKTNFQGHKQYCTSVQIPGTKQSITVEKPETVLERHRFLYTKMMHREANRHFVYIGKAILMANKGNFSYKVDQKGNKNRFILAASPTLGYLGHIYFCRTIKDLNINTWIQEKIEPELPRGCVIIFQENVLDLATEVINSNSTKQQMINCLIAVNIPHDPTLHRAELYKLIIQFKKNIYKFTAIEDMLMTKGHITIRKKKCNLDNDYFDPFWDLLIHELHAKKVSQNMPIRINSYSDVILETANRVFKDLTVEYWSGLEVQILDKEREIYKEDLQMEYVIDQLMTMAKNEGLVEDEREPKLDVYSKQLVEEHFFMREGLPPLLSKELIMRNG